MGTLGKVTVDKAYFDALLRRADFHTSASNGGYSDPPNVSLSRVEYDSLLQASREYESLKSALFQGGITPDTLALLVAGSNNGEQRKDSGATPDSWADDYCQPYQDSTPYTVHPGLGAPWTRATANASSFSRAPGSNAPYYSNAPTPRTNLKVPSFSRQISFGAPPSSMPDDAGFEDTTSLPDEGTQMQNDFGVMPHQERRTLYFVGLSERTTYTDVLSIIKGGKILSINLRNERSATVTFLEGASEFLTWAKRNDIYLHNKRIEVRWADRQHKLNGHIMNKVSNGATRNILIRNALTNGLTESQIRDDMEHIHNLVIVEITYRGQDAYVRTSSVHNALFARTCMLSRTSYKGCKIEFFRDECDTPLRVTVHKARIPSAEPVKRKAPVRNRFDLLGVDGGDKSSDEENRTPVEASSEDDETAEMTSNLGVSLSFLDTDSRA